jgi:two-component system cell cycle response regulator
MNEQLVLRVMQCPNLPSLPAIAVQVLDVTQKADVDIAELARLISKDPALSGKILRTVNSSFYGRSHNVGTISHALVILGLQSVKTLVLGFSLVTNLSKEKPKGFQYLSYWRRSIYAANAARTIAKRVGLVQQEEAFLAALLEDIGMLVLDRVLGDEYGQIHEANPIHSTLAAAETQALGMNHADVGGLMAAHWKLPPLLTIPIAKHHAAQSVEDPTLRKLTELVGIAGVCADVFVDESPATSIAEVRQYFKDRHQMVEVECDALLDEIGRSTREIASLFEINIGSGASFEDILKKANEALVAITLESQQQTNSLLEQNQQLRKEAWTDALTGLANRGRFDQFFADQFEDALKTGQPLALLLMDVDRFKSVNDKHGHPAGDKVLAALGKLVGSAARSTDLAGRYGGEEIVLVLPRTNRAIAATIAESIRRAVAANSIPVGTAELPITASIGVAVVEPGSPFTQPAHLLKAADMAVYAAKHGGRNCVKVFSLKPQAPKTAAA